MDKDILKYWLGFALVPQVGAGRGRKSLNFINTFERAWSASFSDFVQAGIEPTIAQEIVKKRSEIDLDKEMANIEKAEIRIVTTEDEEYPELLKEIYNPPFLLFVRGQINPADKYAVAIVGARRASE